MASLKISFWKINCFIAIICAVSTPLSLIQIISGTSARVRARGSRRDKGDQVWLGEQHHAWAGAHLLRGRQQFQLGSCGGGQEAAHSATDPDRVHTVEATWLGQLCPGASSKGEWHPNKPPADDICYVCALPGPWGRAEGPGRQLKCCWLKDPNQALCGFSYNKSKFFPPLQNLIYSNHTLWENK